MKRSSSLIFVALLAACWQAGWSQTRPAGATRPAGPARLAVATAPAASRPRPGGATSTPASGPVFATAAEYRKYIADRAAAGRLTDEVQAVFLKYAEAAAREKLVPATVPEEFWSWATADRRLRAPLLLMLDPLYGPGVPQRLKELRDADAKGTDRLNQLALAFAAVYGGRARPAAGTDGPRLAASAPTMAESFAYYVKAEKELCFPIAQVPWPLLAYVADNALPLDERAWAMRRCRGRKDWDRFYYDVPYDDAKAATGKGRLGDRPYTLANIVAFGGVCSDRAYYSANILKSLGVPAMTVHGDGARGGHAWLAWCGEQNRQIALLDSGRFDYDQYLTGWVQCPLDCRDVLDRNVELLAKAVATSYDKYLEAEIACHVYDLTAAEKGVRPVALLQDAAGRNAYCEGIWRRLGQAATDRVLPQDQAEKMFDRMLAAFDRYPDLTFDVLQKVLAPRLDPAASRPTEKPAPGRKPPSADAEMTANLQLLDKIFAFYDKRERPDLAVEVRCLQATYLEGLGKKDVALRVCAQASKDYARKHFGFLKLFDRALALMTDNDVRLKYLDEMAAAVPEYQSNWNRDRKLRNPSFEHVLRQYASALTAAGQDAKAAALLARLKQ